MIPLARPSFGPEICARVSDVLASGMLVQGSQVAAFEHGLAERTGYAHAVVVSSGTAALYLGLRALGVGAEHDVWCPALTWPSPAHAALLLGARVRLVDVDAASWNAEPQNYHDALRGSREVARSSQVLVAIDQFGNPVDLEGIAALSGGDGGGDDAAPTPPILLDAACSLGSWGARRTRLGRIACLSFHPRKVLTTGEGGACLTDDRALADQLRCLRNHGQRSPGKFVMPAHNMRMTDVAAALGPPQLDGLDATVAARNRIAQRYRAAFPSSLVMQRVQEGCDWNAQTFGVLVPLRDGEVGTVAEKQRDRWIEALAQRGVQAGKLSYALSQVGSLRDGSLSTAEACPVAEDIAARGLALPVYPEMDEQAIQQVIDAVQDCAASLGREET